MHSACLLKKFVHGCGKGSLFPIETFSFAIRWKADINVAHGRLHCTDACFPHIDKKNSQATNCGLSYSFNFDRFVG